MYKRLVLVLCVLISLGACSAFDSDAEPYEGFEADEVPPVPGKSVGIYSGYYAGTMTVDSNECFSVSDAVGDSFDLALEVLHSDNILNLTFEDGSVSSAEITDTSAIFMVQTGDVKHVYYLDFEVEDAIGGSCEVIEASEDGSFGHPCASYTLSLEETEKPDEDELADFETEDEEQGEAADDGSEDESSDEEEASEEEDIPLEAPLKH
jgi:hypothetical protein